MVINMSFYQDEAARSLRTESGSRVGGWHCLTRTRLLGRQQRGAGEAAREAVPPKREEGWAFKEGGRLDFATFHYGLFITIAAFSVAVRFRVWVRMRIPTPMVHAYVTSPL